MRPLLIFVTWIQLFLVASIGFLFVLAVWLVTRPFDGRRILSGRPQPTQRLTIAEPHLPQGLEARPDPRRPGAEQLTEG